MLYNKSGSHGVDAITEGQEGFHSDSIEPCGDTSVMIKDIPLPFARLEKDGSIIACNNEWDAVRQGKDDASPGGSFLDMIDYPDAEAVREVLQDVSGIDEVHTIEVRISQKGEEQFYLATFCRESFGKGKDSVVVILHDVTLQKRREHELCDMQQRYRFIAENTTDIFIITDEVGGITYISPSCEWIVGRGMEDSDKTIFDVIQPDDIPAVTGTFRDVVEKNLIGRVEFRFAHPEKGYIWLESTGKKTRIDDQIRLVVTSRDITERKRIEIEKLELKDEYEMTIKTLPHHVFRVKKDEDGLMRYVLSEGLIAKRFNITTDVLRDSTLADVFAEPHFSVVSEKFGKAFRGERVQFELTLAGSSFWVIVQPYEHDTSGGVTEIIGFAEDITDWRKTKDKLNESEGIISSTFEALESSLVVLDDEYRVILSNRDTHKGLLSRGSEDGLRCYQLLKGREKPCGSCPVRKLFRDGERRSFEEWDSVTGTCKEVSFVPIWGQNGRVVYVVEKELDITSWKKAEETLMNSKQHVEREVNRKTLELEKAHQKISDYARRLDVKLKKIEEKRIPLTRREKMVFYGLVRYPHLTGKELAGQIGVLPDTVNKKRKRLKDDGYYQTMYIPRFEVLGWELMSLNYAKIDVKRSEGVSGKDKATVRDRILSIPEKIMSYGTSQDFFTLHFSQGWSSFKRMQDRFESEAYAHGYSFQYYKVHHFLANESRVHAFFDFDALIRHRFGIADNSPRRTQADVNRSLTATERDILIGLMRFPDETIRG